MDRVTKDIESITFGLLSSDEILKMSVAKIDNTKLIGPSSVYDDRLGTISDVECRTCHQGSKLCAGHFGHVELTEGIINPLFYKEVRDFLSCICMKCNRFLLMKDQLHLYGFMRYKGQKRFVKILEKLKKIGQCCHCDSPHPEIKYIAAENNIAMVYRQKNEGKMCIVLSVDEIDKIFNNIPVSDIELMGFDTTLVHPRNFVMKYFPVIPICARPYIMTEGILCDDDLTIQIMEIIKANNHLVEKPDQPPMQLAKKQKYLQSLKFRISTFYNNCFAPETPILMWNGKIKRADEIVIGDKLIGDDGEMRTVRALFNGEDEMYEISQADSEPYRVNGNHFITLRVDLHRHTWFNETTGKFYVYWFNKNTFELKFSEFLSHKEREVFMKDLDENNIFDIPVVEYLNFPNEIKQYFHGIKLSTPVKWKRHRVNLCPYAIGWYIGSGFNCSHSLTIGMWMSLCSRTNSMHSLEKNETSIYFIPDKHSYIYKCLDEYNLLKEKRVIPRQYIINDVIIRKQLLEGLIDSLGIICRQSKNIVFDENENPELLNDIKFLANSLALKTTIEELVVLDINGKIQKINRELIIHGEFLNELNLKIKKNEAFTKSKNILNLDEISIQQSEYSKHVGISVDGNMRLLLGDFTVTRNSQGKAKHTTNSRPIKGLKERMTGKEGQMRGNLLGKRCEQTGRTVIGPDPTLKLNELIVPQDMAEILTVPIKVSELNYDKMVRVVLEGKANYLLRNGKSRITLKHALKHRGTLLIKGDEIIRLNGQIEKVVTGSEIIREGDSVRRNGKIIDDLVYPQPEKYMPNIGDVVEQKLHDGCVVILNRQPTLHKASMQAMSVIIKPFKTLRMNLSIMKGFNGDFDGDEMNIHNIASREAQVELLNLSTPIHNMISAQSSKPNLAIVQDSLLGAYRLTKGIRRIEKHTFLNIIMKLSFPIHELFARLAHIRAITKQFGKKGGCFTGKGLFSLILPTSLNYERHNNADLDEPTVRIYRGVIYEGAFDKTILGSAHNSLIQIIYKEYSPQMAATFIDNVQFMTNNWLLHTGFSVGLGDCVITDPNQVVETENVIQKSYMEAEAIKTTTNHAGIRELRVMASLNKAKDIGLKIAKDNLAKDNDFLSTVRSGSKGDFFNITQISGLLGQQNLVGQRVPPVLNHNKRTLPHYPFETVSLEMEYESRGFISSSFIKGLNPRQFFFHAMSGREGVCDTAMGTAKSGYIQRKITKLTEDIHIQYDGTVRDTIGRVYQLAYGEDGMDPIQCVKAKNTGEACDVGRLINKLNMQHELREKRKK
jgi:DNA-directed RNA polymerase beta' subunit